VLTRVRRRARAVRASGDAGVSLTELIVAMILSTILGALTLQLFVTVDTSTSSTTDRTVNTSQASNTMQAWTQYLHIADGTIPGAASARFEWLTSSDMLFYSGLANRLSTLNTDVTASPTMMWLRLDTAGNLVEEQFPLLAAVGATWTACRVLGLQVTAPTLFTAYDANGASLGGADLGVAPTALTGCRPLPVLVPSRSGIPDPVAVANLTTVASVGIAFTMTDSKSVHVQEFKSVVTLPTLGGA
jgi:Tfp pilus assembly protein PilW